MLFFCTIGFSQNCADINDKPIFHLYDVDKNNNRNNLWLYKQENGIGSPFVCPDTNGDGSYTPADLNADGSINTTLHPVDEDGIPGGEPQGTANSKDATINARQLCSSQIFISQINQLKSVDTSTAPFTYTNIGDPAGLFYNAIGFNPIDGYIYGMKVASRTLIKIDPTTGFVETLVENVTGLPHAAYVNGDFDDQGNFYVMKNTTADKLYRIDLSTLTATEIPLSTNLSSVDFAFNLMDGLLYGVYATNADKGKLYSINPVNGEVNLIGNSYPEANTTFGGMIGTSTGELYGIENSGGFYQFDITTGDRTLISSSPPSSSNDAAHCVLAPLTFAVDLYVTKTDGKTTYIPGTTNTYTIVVGNNGPFGAQGALVTDPVPTGIPASNVSYTASVSGGATTDVSGTQIGAINDLVDLPVGGKVTYTVTVEIPVTYTGNLTNTVTITPPASSSYDTDLDNNTATDTDTKVCYKLPNIDTPDGFTKVSISTMEKQTQGWPETIANGFIALDSKEKGFVITQVESESSITDPKEGMLIYDIDAACVKLYNGTVWNCIQKSCNE